MNHKVESWSSRLLRNYTQIVIVVLWESYNGASRSFDLIEKDARRQMSLQANHNFRLEIRRFVSETKSPRIGEKSRRVGNTDRSVEIVSDSIEGGTGDRFYDRGRLFLRLWVTVGTALARARVYRDATRTTANEQKKRKEKEKETNSRAWRTHLPRP